MKAANIVFLSVASSMLAVFMTLSLMGATTANSEKKCKRYSVTSTGDDYYVPLDGRYSMIEFDNDVAGDTAGTQVRVYTCEDKDSNNDGTSDSNACKEHYWDSDDDGARDTSVLTGSAWPFQQRRIFVSAKDVFLDTTAYTSTGSVVVCPVIRVTQ